MPDQVSRKRGKFSTPPLYWPEVVSTMPERIAALTVVLAATRLLRPLPALASFHAVERMLMASQTSEAGLVVEVSWVPTAPPVAL